MSQPFDPQRPPPPGPPAYGYPAASATTSAYPATTALAPSSTSAIVLVVVSAVAVVATGIIGVPSAVLGVLALRSGPRDPAASRRTTRIGWIVFAVNAVVGLALIVLVLWWLRRR